MIADGLKTNVSSALISAQVLLDTLNTVKSLIEVPILVGDAAKPGADVPAPSRARSTNLANWSYQEQEYLKSAAYLFFYEWGFGNQEKVTTIRFIRAITGGNLLQCKQLVDYAVNLHPVRPDWLKQVPSASDSVWQME